MLNKKQNWLLIMAGISLFLAIIGFWYNFEDLIYITSRNFSDSSLFFVILSALVIAPFLEEITFRGIFTKKTYLRYVSLILILVSVIFSQHYYLIPVFIILVLFFVLYLRGNNFGLKVSILLSVLIFGFLHYSLGDLEKLQVYLLILFQITVGLVCCWLTLNYGILKSVFFHFCWNLVFISALLYSLQFLDLKTHEYKNEFVEVIWKKVPRFNGDNSSMKMKDDGILIKNMEPRDFYLLLQPSDSKDERILQSEPFMKTDMEIKLRDNEKNKNLKKQALEFLIESDLILIEKK